MLPPRDLDHYRENGWLVPDYRVPHALLAAARQRAGALMAARPDYRDLYPDLLGADIRFIQIAREPGLLDLLEALIGPDIVLWTAGMFGKPAGDGKATPWHQDGEYWPIRPLETATVWVALDRSDTGNGCLRVVDGSHRARRLFAHNSRSGADLTLSREVEARALEGRTVSDIVLEPGQISIHDVYLVHGSAPNRSPRRRAGITYRYMPGHCLFDRDLAARQHRESGVPDIARRPLYRLRGDGERGPNRIDPFPEPQGVT